MELKKILHESDDYTKMVDLRMEILRKPLGLLFSPEELKKENEDILIGAFENDLLVGCCVLSPYNSDTLKLRQMAVVQNQQQKGIGRSVLNFAERTAIESGYKKILLHARETALPFYKTAGYETEGDSFLEVTLTHYRMKKNLL